MTTSLHPRTQADTIGFVTRKRAQPVEMSVRDARTHFADVLFRAAAGRITYVTSRGRRIAAVVPLSVAEDAEEGAEPDVDPDPETA